MEIQKSSLRHKLGSYWHLPAVQHAFFISMLFLTSLWYFHPLLSTTQTLNNIHYLDNLAFLSHSIEQATSEYGEFPLWNPYTFGGIPLMGIPEHAMLDFNVLLVLLTKEVYLSMNLALIIYFFIAGLGMYILIFSLATSKPAAFLSALLFMFNGFMHSFIKGGHINLLESYSLIPFVILFAHLSLSKETKNIFLYSFLSGIFLAMQIFAGGIIFFLYTVALLGLLFTTHLITKFSFPTIKRLLLSGALIGIIAFGVSAVKLLPTLEFTAQSNREGGVSYQEYLGEPVGGDWWGLLVFNHSFQGVNAAMGIAGSLLMLLGLLSFRKRYVMFSLVVMLLSLLLASGGFIAQFFYDSVPGFGKMRHIERALVFFAFAAPLLAGFGAKNLFSNLEKNNVKWGAPAAFAVVLLIISADMIFFQPFPQTIDVTQPEDIGLLAAIENDKDTFRIINLGLKEFIGSSGYVYYMQKGIGDVKGGGGIWPSDYPEFLYLAQQSAPSKLWGILNVKYVISDKEATIPNTELIGTFNNCTTCIIPTAFGPYVYKNNNFLPRAYAAENSVLVIGEQKIAKELIYFLLLNSKSQATAFIQDDSIGKYTLEELKRYSAVVLAAGSIDQQSGTALRAYANSGGNIFPDIFNGENSMTEDAIARLLNATTGTIKPVLITRSSFHTLDLDVRNVTGLVVVSERYAFYSGWKAYADGAELELLKVDNYITGVYLDKPYQTVAWEYKPASFSRGLLITLSTLLGSLGYFVFIFIRKRKTMKNANTQINKKNNEH